MSTILKNYFYSTSGLIIQYLYPLIILPYVLSIFDPDTYGLINFYEGISRYFIFISFLGLAQYGTREIAKIESNKKIKLFQEIIGLHFLSTIFFSISYLIFSFLFIKEETFDSTLVIYGFIYIISNVFTIDWFYNGNEKFKLLAFRIFVARIIIILYVFLIVKDKEDYHLFFLTNIILNIVQILFAYKPLASLFYASLFNLKFKKHLKPALQIFLIIFFIQSYSSLDIILIEYLSNTSEVAYYSVATKLLFLPVTFFAAITTVFIPKTASYFKQKSMKKVELITNFSFFVIISLGLVFSFFTFFSSEEIVLLISNSDYIKSAVIMKTIFPIIIIMGLNNLLAFQFFMSLNYEFYLSKIFLFVFVIRLALSFSLIPIYLSMGSAISFFISELILMTLLIFKLKKIINLKILNYGFLVRIIFLSISLNYIIEIIPNLLSNKFQIIIDIFTYLLAISLYVFLFEKKTYRNLYKLILSLQK